MISQFYYQKSVVKCCSLDQCICEDITVLWPRGSKWKKGFDQRWFSWWARPSVVPYGLDGWFGNPSALTVSKMLYRLNPNHVYINMFQAQCRPGSISAAEDVVMADVEPPTWCLHFPDTWDDEERKRENHLQLQCEGFWAWTYHIMTNIRVQLLWGVCVYCAWECEVQVT